MITEKGRKETYENEEEGDFKKQIKILTIENQKLVGIIEKMQKEQGGKKKAERSHEKYEE